MSATSSPFRPALFAFLRDLERNNKRDWFEANRSRYEKHLLHPAQEFTTEFAPRLRRISRHFNADPRPGKGTLFRIYRDVRFSKDKSPYKTHAGIHFRHQQAKNAYAPGRFQPAEFSTMASRIRLVVLVSGCQMPAPAMTWAGWRCR